MVSRHAQTVARPPAIDVAASSLAGNARNVPLRGKKLFLRPKLQIARGIRFTASGRSVLRPLEQLTLTFEELKDRR
jgi:hypothetical protein